MQAADRSLRSVFVGNIPYDATEEKLRDIFSAVGPVLSFRIVFDRESGKPKGFGFCEYKDQETATSAIRNLNGHDLGGRQLRVDSASNERVKDEPEQQLQQQQQQMNQQQQQQHQQQQQQPVPVLLGDGNQAQISNQAPQMPEPLADAQTVINNVLRSLTPEQLFDVCKQLKSSLLVNPNETRQMLAQNPQLSFAILQSLVMIKAIDAQTAMNTLHEQLVQPAPIQPTAMPMLAPMMQPQVLQPFPFVPGPGPMGPPTTMAQGPPVGAPVQITGPPQQSQPQGGPAGQPNQMPPMDQWMATSADPRNNAPNHPGGPQVISANPNGGPVDPRLAGVVSGNTGPIGAADIRLNTDPRLAPGDPRLMPGDARMQPGPGGDPRLAAADPRLASADPRLAAAADPRLASTDPRLASVDPRLARQQQQQQQQQQQAQQQQQWPFTA